MWVRFRVSIRVRVNHNLTHYKSVVVKPNSLVVRCGRFCVHCGY